MKMDVSLFWVLFVQLVGVNKSLFRVLIHSRFGVSYSNFSFLTLTFWKVSIEKYGKTPTFSGRQHFTTIFKILVRTLTIYNVQRALTPKVCKQELWFLCSACWLMVWYLCVKIYENISNLFKLQGGHEHKTEIIIYNVQMISLSRNTRVMVLVFCRWSPDVLYFCSFMKTSKMLFKLWSGHDFVTDKHCRWTDCGKNNVS